MFSKMNMYNVLTKLIRRFADLGWPIGDKSVVVLKTDLIESQHTMRIS